MSTGVCSWCSSVPGPVGIVHCPRCDGELYCSVRCQKAHAQTHKLRCNPLDAKRRQEQKDDELFYAAGRCDVSAVEALIAQGSNVNYTEPSKGGSPLQYAAQEGHIAIVQLLVDSKADVNYCRPSDCATALFIAAQQGHSTVVKALITSGSDPSFVRPYDGVTPLFIACQEGRLEVVNVLIAAGVDLDLSRPNDLTTSLMVSVRQGHVEIVHALLTAGADPRLVDAAGHSALFVAKHFDHPAIALMIESRIRQLTLTEAVADAN